MRQLFKSKFKQTQAFGVNKEYYSQFSLAGHEGGDYVPIGTVWDVFCLEDGVVVRDIDDAALGKNYGKNITIWHPTIKKATQYCHLAGNSVSNGERVTKGQVIGVMGSTGNTTGAHIHLNLFDVDDNGVRLNRDNGFFGGIDPLPFLEEDTQPATDLQTELNQVRQARDSHWNDIIAISDKLKVSTNRDIILAEIEKLLAYEDAVRQKDKQVQDATVKIDQLQFQVAQLLKDHEQVSAQNQELVIKTDEQQTLIENLSHEAQNRQRTIDDQGDTINDLQADIKALQTVTGMPILSGWRKFIVDIINKL